MQYKIIFTKKADKELRKIDKNQQKIIINWISKNLENTEDPRKFGKALKGNLKDYWRYRVGKYRIIADIDDNEIKIIIVKINHRRKIYK